MTTSANHYNIKGTLAEDFIAKLCSDAFFADFCFMNPYYKKGKELCDVLLILNDVAIIWQIKNLKIGDDGMFSQSEINKAVKQCHGSKRQLLLGNQYSFKNVAGKVKMINTTKLKRIYLVAAIEGGTEDISHFYHENNKGNVHIFYEAFTRFAIAHLNTISDFVKYLQDKESFISGKNMIIGGGEKDLAAFYLTYARTFGDQTLLKSNRIFFDIEGAAKNLEEDQDYKDKLTADYWSKGWDMLIEKKREGIANVAGEDDNEMRDIFLSKMMSHNRFERRYLAKTYFDAAVEATKYPYQPTFAYRRYVPMPEHGVTYVFGFMGSPDESREWRKLMIQYAALAARKRFPINNMVIAVVSDLHMVKSNVSGFDWALMEMDNKTMNATITKGVEDTFMKLKLFDDPKMEIISTFEYPSDLPKHLRNDQ